MPKGVTQAVRFVISRREYENLLAQGRQFDRPRVTSNNLAAFTMRHEDLRSFTLNDVLVLELVNGQT